MTPTRNKAPFFAALTFLALANAATAEQTFQAGTDADVLVLGLTFDARDAADVAALADPNLLLMLTTGGSGQQVTQVPVPLKTIAGDGRQLVYLPAPILVQKGATLTGQLTNKHGAVVNVRLTLHCAKLV